MNNIQNSYWDLYSVFVSTREKGKKVKPLDFSGCLRYGKKYGMLSIQNRSKGFYNKFYFFRNTDYDKVYINILNPQFVGNNIQINIFDEYTGVFVINDIKSRRKYDKYILDVLTEINDTVMVDDEESLFNTFNTIECELKLKTAWKKLKYNIVSYNYEEYKYIKSDMQFFRLHRAWFKLAFKYKLAMFLQRELKLKNAFRKLYFNSKINI